MKKKSRTDRRLQTKARARMKLTGENYSTALASVRREKEARGTVKATTGDNTSKPSAAARSTKLLEPRPHLAALRDTGDHATSVFAALAKRMEPLASVTERIKEINHRVSPITALAKRLRLESGSSFAAIAKLQQSNPIKTLLETSSTFSAVAMLQQSNPIKTLLETSSTFSAVALLQQSSPIQALLNASSTFSAVAMLQRPDPTRALLDPSSSFSGTAMLEGTNPISALIGPSSSIGDPTNAAADSAHAKPLHELSFARAVVNPIEHTAPTNAELAGELAAVKARVAELEAQVEKDQRPLPDVLPPKRRSSDPN